MSCDAVCPECGRFITETSDELAEMLLQGAIALVCLPCYELLKQEDRGFISAEEDKFFHRKQYASEVMQGLVSRDAPEVKGEILRQCCGDANEALKVLASYRAKVAVAMRML